MTDQPRTWLITGASRGLGRAFVNAALQQGDRVIATLRDPAALEDLADDHSGNLLLQQHDDYVRNPGFEWPA